MSAFGYQQYWDKRYEEEEFFEWYYGYDVMGPVIGQYRDELGLQKDQMKVLMIGCGNSGMIIRGTRSNFVQTSVMICTKMDIRAL